MLRNVGSAVLFVPNLADAIIWYRIVLGTQPVFVTDRTVYFPQGEDAGVCLLCTGGRRSPRSAVLLCDDLEAALPDWRQWLGVIETECLGPGLPVRLVILRDPGDNCLAVLGARATKRAVRRRVTRRPRSVQPMVACRSCGGVAVPADAPAHERGEGLCPACLRRRKAPFPRLLRACRLAAGMYRWELARLVGVEESTLLRYEAGHQRPRRMTLARLVAVLGPGILAES